MNKICVFSDFRRLLSWDLMRFINILIFIFIPILYQTACTSSTTSPDTEITHAEEEKQRPTASHILIPNTITPIASLEIVPPTATVTFEGTQSKEIVVSTPTVEQTLPALPTLLIAGIEVKQKGEEDEVHEVWLIDTLTGEKQKVFSTTPGTRLSTMIWGDNQSNILYIAEIREIGEGNPTWQLYEVNYGTGEIQAFFKNPQEGVPRLLDTSAQDKWLRVWVDFFDPMSFEWWFINTEDNTVIKADQDAPYLSSFVWSPNEPDTFVYFQESRVEDGQNLPQSIVFSEVTKNFETTDAIEHKYTSLGSPPLLMWDLSIPQEIMFLTPDEAYIIDIVQHDWRQVGESKDVFPGNAFTQLLKSPTGQWAVTTTFIRTIQLNDELKVVERFEDKVGQGHKFLSWYGDEDWMVIRTREGIVQIYKLDDESILIDEINLSDYGLVSARENIILAKPLK